MADDFTPKKWDDVTVPDAVAFNSGDKVMGLQGSVVKRFARSLFDALYVLASRTISTTAPLSGGGNLSANRTLSIQMATARLLGRTTAGSGVAEEISVGSGLALSSGTLSATSPTHVVSTGSAPAVAGVTGLGTGGSLSVSGTDSAFTISLNTGTGPGSTGDITITFAVPFATPPVVIAQISHAAQGWYDTSWVRVITDSASAPVIRWNAVGGNLGASNTWKIDVHVVGRP